ncbi:MAG: PEGA domain-containing protein [Deltaproteobacteria bacterium]|nr:PEGA domain-containing protein [Deltaproteobacteria bacterium]
MAVVSRSQGAGAGRPRRAGPRPLGGAEAHLVEALAARDPWVRSRLAILQSALAEIRRHVGRLDVVGEPSGAEVVIDGAVVGQLPLSTMLRVPTGSLTFTVRSEGYFPVTRTVQVEAPRPPRPRTRTAPGRASRRARTPRSRARAAGSAPSPSSAEAPTPRRCVTSARACRPRRRWRSARASRAGRCS